MRPFWRGKTYKVKCKGGSVRTVHRDIAEAFPFYVRTKDVGGGADVGALLGMSSAQAKAQYKSKVDAVLFSLDELNQSLMFQFRIIYAEYESDPCKNGSSFDRQLERLVEELQWQTTWRMKARALTELAGSDAANHAQIMTIFNELVSGIGGPGVPLAAAEEIGQARIDTRRWLEGPPSPDSDNESDASGDGTIKGRR